MDKYCLRIQTKKYTNIMRKIHINYKLYFYHTMSTMPCRRHCNIFPLTKNKYIRAIRETFHVCVSYNRRVHAENLFMCMFLSLNYQINKIYYNAAAVPVAVCEWKRSREAHFKPGAESHVCSAIPHNRMLREPHVTQWLFISGIKSLSYYIKGFFSGIFCRVYSTL